MAISNYCMYRNGGSECEAVDALHVELRSTRALARFFYRELKRRNALEETSQWLERFPWLEGKTRKTNGRAEST